MTLALQVGVGTPVFWLLLLFARWINVLPVTAETSRRSAFAAAGLSGAYIGGGYPLMWAMARNVGAWIEHGSTTFTFAGNLPPGVDEDDLLVMLVLGMTIFVGQSTAEAWRVVRRTR
jgi:hypothetical protein